MFCTTWLKYFILNSTRRCGGTILGSRLLKPNDVQIIFVHFLAFLSIWTKTSGPTECSFAWGKRTVCMFWRRLSRWERARDSATKKTLVPFYGLTTNVFFSSRLVRSPKHFLATNKKNNFFLRTLVCYQKISALLRRDLKKIPVTVLARA